MLHTFLFQEGRPGHSHNQVKQNQTLLVWITRCPVPGIYSRSSGFQKAWMFSAIHSTCSVVVSDWLCSTTAAVLGGQVSAARVYIYHFWNLSRASIACHTSSASLHGPFNPGLLLSWGCPVTNWSPWPLSAKPQLLALHGPLMPLKVIPPGRLFDISKFNCQCNIQL